MFISWKRRYLITRTQDAQSKDWEVNKKDWEVNKKDWDVNWLGSQQERLGSQQERLGSQQERLGSQQERLRSQQERLGSQQDTSSQIRLYQQENDIIFNKLHYLETVYQIYIYLETSYVCINNSEDVL